MLKKWVYTLLSFWLINSVTYFHGSNSADHVSHEHSSSPIDACFTLNTWADCIIHSFVKEDDDASGKAHKIKYQRRYVHSRSVDGNLFVSVANLYIYQQHFKSAVISTVNHYCIGVALLPAYYSFLFRLCPF